jgi:hypothetical protein
VTARPETGEGGQGGLFPGSGHRRRASGRPFHSCGKRPPNRGEGGSQQGTTTSNEEGRPTSTQKTNKGDQIAPAQQKGAKPKRALDKTHSQKRTGDYKKYDQSGCTAMKHLQRVSCLFHQAWPQLPISLQTPCGQQARTCEDATRNYREPSSYVTG